jgi:CPA2 family monovalent cation:H+ antiporter-2
VLAALGRLADRIGMPSIPLFLVSGLAMGEGGIVPLDASTEFVRIGADLGVVILLLLLGLEYSPADLQQGMVTSWRAGVVDLVANGVPGVLLGLALGWGPIASTLLGGATYISSSGIIARQLGDLERIANRETPVVLTILVIEDLVMAVFLPIVGVLILGLSIVQGGLSIAAALAVVVIALLVASRYSGRISGFLDSPSQEVLLLTVLGLTLLIGGAAEEIRISAAVVAFLIGLTLSGSVAERGREVLMPIRDVFGGLFFVFFGLQIDPATLPPVLLPALLLASVTAWTKMGTGWWAAGQAGVGPRGRMRAALSLTPRGEFSIVLAGLGVAAGLEADLGPLVACYVLILAVCGSLAMRFADDVPIPARLLPART